MDRATPSTACANTLHCALELSKKSWLLAIQFPDREQPSLYPIEGGNGEKLMAKLTAARECWAKVSGAVPVITLCYEVGHDAFWLARFLKARGVECLVIDPGSLQVNRRGRRVKTDRIDVKVLLRTLLWIASGEAAKLERATLMSYRILLDRHLVPLIGAVKLSQLTVPLVRTFEDRLRADRSPAMVRKIMVALTSVLGDAQERGLVAQNVARSLRTNRRRDKDRQSDRRQKGKLQAGVDIPRPDEIRAILAALSGRWRPLILTAIFTGLRASELRGLRWADVDLKAGELHVRQRADRFNEIGAPKSAAGERTIPTGPMVVNTLREWRLACPKSELDLVFPTGRGRVDSLSSIVRRIWWPAQIAAGVVDERGKAKYPGLHALRHFYASWCINRRVDGGLELPLKLVQARLGHSTVNMTADVYGHLFPWGDDGAELAAAEKTFLS